MTKDLVPARKKLAALQREFGREIGRSDEVTLGNLSRTIVEVAKLMDELAEAIQDLQKKG